MIAAPRCTVLWCPDWPVVAAGVEPLVPAAVVSANRVVSTTAAARAAGVRRDQRRRQAQSLCPDLLLLEHDPLRDVREYEVVLGAVVSLTPLVEVLRPGLSVFPTRGPARYLGGERSMMQRLEEVVGEALGGRGEALAGTADGVFAAGIAARRRDPGERLVPSGGSADFLAPLPVSLLGDPELSGVLERLGLRTLGAFAALGEADVAARFGAAGLTAHRRASGADERLLDPRAVPGSFEVAVELDPPLERVDQAAFAAKPLAGELQHRLESSGLVCSLVVIRVETEHGERFERRWRGEGSLSAAAIVQRLRWQLDGWLNGPAATRPSGALSRLVLLAEEVRAASGRQYGFWGTRPEEIESVERVLARVGASSGVEAVRVPESRGGRDPASQVVLVPASTVDLSGERRASGAAQPAAPWPGRLPPPSPATLCEPALTAELLDADGRAVTVDGRGSASAPPRLLSVPGGAAVEVTAWSGPWPLDERWWDLRGRRRARMQVLGADGVARLLAIEAGRWSVEAVYD